MDYLPIILIVDDEDQILSSLKRELRGVNADIIVTTDALKALVLLKEKRISVLICDINMPLMNGVELLKRSITLSPDTIRVVLTGSTDSSLFVAAVNDARISTFLSKPWDKTALLLAVDQALTKYDLQQETARLSHEIVLQNELLQEWNYKLEKEVHERTNELNLTQEATVLSLIALTETRDNETGNHILRTQNYVKILAQELARNPEYSEFLTDHTIDQLYKSAPLHDIGKVGIPDAVLKKDGELYENEFEIMKQHPVFGRNAISKAERKVGKMTFLTFASEIAYSHHEHWDGSGYPEALKGEDIPLSARIMAVADVYDALVMKRCYKEAFSHEEAFDLICQGRGTHFDPKVVDVFMVRHEELRRVAQQFAD